MDDLALKHLKVADLKRILADAGIAVPSRLNKSDLISRIQAEPAALAVFRAQHQLPPATAPEPRPPAATAPAPAPAPAAAPAPSVTSAVPPPATTKSVSAADTELEKRKARAARFGIPLVNPLTDDEGKLKARAQRFGIKPPATGHVDSEELEKRRKRAERFGTTVLDASS